MGHFNEKMSPFFKFSITLFGVSMEISVLGQYSITQKLNQDFTSIRYIRIGHFKDKNQELNYFLVL